MINFLFAQLQREARTEEWLRPLSTRLKVTGVIEVLDLDANCKDYFQLRLCVCCARNNYYQYCYGRSRSVIADLKNDLP